MKNTHQQNPLAGKRVLIFGGSSGLGFATAKAVVAEGATVIIVSSNPARIEEALKQLPENSEGHAIDLSSEENIKDLFGKMGRFDHLVYTAGENLSLSKVADTAIDQARDFFNVRFWGAFTAIKYGAALINEGGSICLTSGTASARPGSGWGLAASLCAAMEGFCRAMAVELAPVRVNAVAPGVIKTNLWNNMTESDRNNFYESVGNAQLVKRVGEADEIAQTFVFMMKQSYATGQIFTIDGGSALM